MNKLFPIVLLAFLPALAAMQVSGEQPKDRRLATAVWGSRNTDDVVEHANPLSKSAAGLKPTR